MRAFPYPPLGLRTPTMVYEGLGLTKGRDELVWETELPEGVTKERLLGPLTSGTFLLRPMASVVGCAGAAFFSLALPRGALECTVVLRLEPLLMA